MTTSLRLAFAGTPDFAARHLQALVDAGHTMVGVLTQPDRPAGRGQKLMPSPVKQVALAHGIAIDQPVSLRTDEGRATLAAWQPDLLIVVAYGLLLPQAVLDLPRLGCINVHGSLLPRWRGAAPVQRAIEAGDAETGITIMQMDAGLDTGAMLLKVQCPITATTTSADLFATLTDLGPQALLDAVAELATTGLPAEPQDEALATYARKLSKEEARVDWHQSASVLDRRIRAFQPWPGAQITVGEHTIKILRAEPVAGHGTPGTILDASATGIDVATADGALRLHMLQLPGGRPQTAAELLNGRRDLFVTGQRLESVHE